MSFALTFFCPFPVHPVIYAQERAQERANMEDKIDGRP